MNINKRDQNRMLLRIQERLEEYRYQISMAAGITLMNGIACLTYITSPNQMLTSWEKIAQSMNLLLMPLVLIVSTVICIIQKKNSLYQFFKTGLSLFLATTVTCFVFTIVNKTDAGIFLGSYIASSGIVGSAMMATLMAIAKTDESNKNNK